MCMNTHLCNSVFLFTASTFLETNEKKIKERSRKMYSNVGYPWHAIQLSLVPTAYELLKTKFPMEYARC